MAGGRHSRPAHGIPLTQGLTRPGRRADDGRVAGCGASTSPMADAPVIGAAAAAGAVFVGKTNLHEFAFGTTSEDSAFGPATQSARSDALAGGSSGGSAVAVATGMALASVGTDTGGSIRIPSAACGIVGLKPA